MEKGSLLQFERTMAAGSGGVPGEPWAKRSNVCAGSVVAGAVVDVGGVVVDVDVVVDDVEAVGSGDAASSDVQAASSGDMATPAPRVAVPVRKRRRV